MKQKSLKKVEEMIDDLDGLESSEQKYSSLSDDDKSLSLQS